MANFCQNCGAPLDPSSRFCERCGSATGNMLYVQPVQYAQPTVKPKKSGGGLKAVVAILLVVVIAVGGLFAYKSFADKPENRAGDVVKTEENIETTSPVVKEEYSVLNVGSGGTSGTYYAYAGVLGTIVGEKTGVKWNVCSTDGSVANSVGIDDGAFQLAIAQSDVVNLTYSGERFIESGEETTSLRIIGGLYYEVVQIVTVDPEIKSVADLKGKRVAIGWAGSGVYYNALDILGAAGLSVDDIDARALSFGDAVDSLKDGYIDAAFVTAGVPTVSLTELSTVRYVDLVPIDGQVAENLLASSPYYSEYLIKRETYTNQMADVATVAVKATLVVSEDVSDDVVYNITKAIWENTEEITAAHAKGAELDIYTTLNGLGNVPLHPGAERYYREKGIEKPTVSAPVEQNPAVEEKELVITEIIPAVYEKIGDVIAFPVDTEGMEIDLSDADSVYYYLGLDDASQITEAYFSESMIGAQAYSFVVVRLADGADGAYIRDQMYENIDRRKWVCVEANQAEIVIYNDLIAFVMVDSASLGDGLAKSVVDAFIEVCDRM